MRYFGSNNVESVAENWTEVDGIEWSWAEVGAWFNNTSFKLIKKLAKMFRYIWSSNE